MPTGSRSYYNVGSIQYLGGSIMPRKSHPDDLFDWDLFVNEEEPEVEGDFAGVTKGHLRRVQSNFERSELLSFET
ncbi:uncharacterized protein N7500_007704 [Penicillium coprophilum]|uniref:uncharacterized protein n=1 Tax=Penicillium coprophilum TaxID=36646 RepID=UPI00238AB86A|nr:uncharacterized protein N7500_007704 [Penicillium coprophilum]KAJ5158053.1 hypothetical protein N7500_007704 [Penicillium coprophilum]